MYGFDSMQRLYRRPWIGVVAGGMFGAVVGLVVGALVGDVDTALSLGLIFAVVGTYAGFVARQGRDRRARRARGRRRGVGRSPGARGTALSHVRAAPHQSGATRSNRCS